MTPLTEEVFEVEMAKSTVRWNLPLQIGFFVYQYAKLRMLEFHFDFVDKFVSRSDYQLCEMDTDSLYMALSTSTLEEAVRPGLKAQFFKIYNCWFPSPSCHCHHSHFVYCKLEGKSWTPAPCCLQRQQFDKRTPGLFKLEYTGDGIVALCSKTYYCFGTEGNKLSCKGINKRQNTLTKETYLGVLEQRKSGSGMNVGFKTDGKDMFTYSQVRDSLSYLYIKRQVGKDGVSTTPLDI